MILTRLDGCICAKNCNYFTQSMLLAEQRQLQIASGWKKSAQTICIGAKNIIIGDSNKKVKWVRMVYKSVHCIKWTKKKKSGNHSTPSSEKKTSKSLANQNQHTTERKKNIVKSILDVQTIQRCCWLVALFFCCVFFFFICVSTPRSRKSHCV